jgi:hypothetical protein
MKQLYLGLLIFLMNLHVALCPNIKSIYIASNSPIIYKPVYTASYDPLINAIGHFETHNVDTLINLKEQAYGRLQIRQCRLNDYNKVAGTNYTLKDMFDFTKAKEVFLYYATHDNNGKVVHNKPYEQVAKNWNGSGPLTKSYWDAIQEILDPSIKRKRQERVIEAITTIDNSLLIRI